MLSYRHVFHAGNHADVLKHAILIALLDHLLLKDKSFWYIDTHAGAGAYSLREGYARKNAEFETGIARLWSNTDLPPTLARYHALVRALNADGELRFYPGSPYLAWQVLREQDRLRLFELHPTEIQILRENFRDAGRRAMIVEGDGFRRIKAILPPAPRRALTLIDPSFEDKRDYARTLECLTGCLARFPTGIYAVWYPGVQCPEARRFPEQLKLLAALDSANLRGWLHARLTVGAPRADGFGLYGSGIFIVNPPYRLAHTLRATLSYLARALSQDAYAGFALEQDSV